MSTTHKSGTSVPHHPRLTEGGGRPSSFEKWQKSAARELPKIVFAEPSQNYCRLLAHGWDTYTESYDFLIGELHRVRLDEARAIAENADSRGGAVAAVRLGKETFHVLPHGGRGGVRWILRNDDMAVDLRAADRWPMTVRYSAAGLWEHGLQALQGRVNQMLRSGFHWEPEDARPVVGQCHYAFDFYAPAFTDEMRAGISNNVVCHSRSKVRAHNLAMPTEEIGTSARVQTLTIGSKAGLQLQVYDKTAEITEVSGKTWMRDLWARNGFEFSDDEWGDVWRLEIRFGKGFLRERNIRHPAEIARFLPELIAEALFTRRLCVPTNDMKRRRWPMHPLWTAAYRVRGAPAMLPIGRHPTERKSKLDAAVHAQLAGSLRALTVLRVGEFDLAEARDIASHLVEFIVDDPDHAKKAALLRERYRFVDEMW